MKQHSIWLMLFIIFISTIFCKNLEAYESELNNLSSIISKKIEVKGKNTVAVIDFTDLQGNVTELGRFIAEELSILLASKDSSYSIIDRSLLKMVLKEHNLSFDGTIDPSTALELQKIIGIDALVVGTLTLFWDYVHIRVKIVNTSTPEIIGAAGDKLEKTQKIEELISQGRVAVNQQSTISPNTKPNKVIITSPNSGAKIGYKVHLKGESVINDNSSLWVLLHMKGWSDQWWPQSRPYVQVNGEWETTVYAGGENDIGKIFQIAVATFDGDEEKKILEYMSEGKKTGKWLPIEFPTATSNVYSIDVIKAATSK